MSALTQFTDQAAFRTFAPYPAYRFGLTIEKREGTWCVTNDFGGRIVTRCIDEQDAVEMRERAALGFPAAAVELAVAIDVTKNRVHAAKLAIQSEFSEEPFQTYSEDRTIIRYGVMNDFGMLWGEASTDEPSTHAVALERLLHAVRADAVVHMRAAE